MMFNEMIENPALLTDGYKFCHKDQYPAGLEWTYETWTPRKSRIDGVTHAVFFGLQGALATLYWKWQKGFFERPLDIVMEEIKESLTGTFGVTNPQMVKGYDYSHFEKLHKLGYLPIEVKALKEGSFVQIGGEFVIDGEKVRKDGVPMFTIENTHPDFFWLPGYLETPKSCLIWQPMTDATIADKYKRILTHYAELTGCNQPNRVFNQGGDFSMRGMGSPEAAYRSTPGHLLSFGGSATIPARNYLMAYYNAKPDVIAYAPSTEHSVMESYGRDEKNAILTLITKVYPSGTVTIVSDTYNLWNLVDNVLTDPEVKEAIMHRKGKVNIRPDSGDPVEIICGDAMVYEKELNERLNGFEETIEKGLIQRLYEIFGGTKNEKGFIEVDSHIGCVYGDSITPERAIAICEGLKEKGFVTVSVGLGIGSYTYQYVTRDTLGFALKGTAEIVNGEFRAIYKDPATDSGKFKKSQKGLVAVVFEDGDYKLIDNLTPETIKHVKGNLLEPVFVDGQFVRTQTFDEIRELVASESKRVYNGKF